MKTKLTSLAAVPLMRVATLHAADEHGDIQPANLRFEYSGNLQAIDVPHPLPERPAV